MEMNGLKAKAQEHELLSHPMRLFILDYVKKNRSFTWTEVQTELDRDAKRRLNPNTINFHLTRLVEAGFLVKQESEDQRYIGTERAFKVTI